MKNYTKILIAVFMLFCTIAAFGQVTNLTINGSTSNFTMTSGSNISWSYNVPAGTTTLGEIWYDVNGNGTIDAGDILYQSFNQTDGDTLGQSGPPDMDGQVNGIVTFSGPVGIAPGKFVLKFTEGGVSATIAGTANPLSSPAYTIKGTVTAPVGKSAANIFVELKRKDKYQPNFWDAITDANGNYTIAMNSDTAGNPWTITLNSNPFPPYVITPAEYEVTISGNITGKDFSFTAAAAQVAGTVKDENGNPIANANVNINSFDATNPVNINVKTNISGEYQIGLTQADLNQNAQSWIVYSYSEGSNEYTTTKLDGRAFIQTISPGDSTVRNIVIYNANSFVTGKVTLNGNVPGFPIQLAAVNPDSAQSTTFSDASTGNFSFPVSNKVYSYQIYFFNTSQMYYMNNVTVHPGETNVQVALSTTMQGVKNDPNKLPESYSLEQNYPNPFNPATTINYSLPKDSKVVLDVYNLIGQKVATLVNREQQAGSYSVQFSAASRQYTSGVYFYRLQAGNFVETKKLILLK